jgi:hypothetical protein
LACRPTPFHIPNPSIGSPPEKRANFSWHLAEEICMLGSHLEAVERSAEFTRAPCSEVMQLPDQELLRGELL